jgi:diguanylate cyclase (GGDEF)-like protein/PAS domain S-box-containing protein
MRRASLLSTETVNRSRVLDTLVNNLAGMAYRCLNDEHWTMVFVSRGCEALTGYTPDQLLGQQEATSWEHITYPEDRQRVRQVIQQAVATGQRFAVQYRITTQQGQLKQVSERGVPVPDEHGVLVVEGFIEDITEYQATLDALTHAELRYRHIFEHASEGIFQTTREGYYLAANPALAHIYGYDSAQALMADLSDIDRRLYVKPGRREVFHRLMQAQGQVLNFESEVYRRDGTRIWISENAHVVLGPKGEFICYEGTVQDISERRHYQEQLERQANHDLLTGLPNRVLLADRIDQGIARATLLGYYLALVFIDLDNFKFINDSLGHAAGDELLKEVAARLASCLRGPDTVARLGGDEFVLVINDHYRTNSVISLLERILQEIGRPIMLSGREFHVGASLGVAMYP